MSSRTISVDNFGVELVDLLSECNSLQLLSAIRQLEICLRYAKELDLIKTVLDQRLFAAEAASESLPVDVDSVS